MKTLISLACAIAGVSTLLAQTVPPLMNYQGRLTDEAGNPLANGQYLLQFKLFNTPTASTGLIWGATYTDVAVVNGQFNVVLGAAGGTPVAGAETGDISLAFISAERYLEMSIIDGATTNTIAPRQQILSSPYAFNIPDGLITADKVASDVGVWTRSGQHISYTSGRVGIGTATPGAKLHVAGDTALFDRPNGAIRVTKVQGQQNTDDLGIWYNQSFWIAGWNTDEGILVNTTSGDVTATGRLNGNQLTATENNENAAVSPGQYYRDNSIVAWGRVSAGGTWPNNNTFGVSQIEKTGTGTYRITISATMSSSSTLIPCVTPFTSNEPRWATFQPDTQNRFYVRIWEGIASSWALVDTDFTFIVTGR